MTEFVLHHHDPSPFAEKIRKTFGVKGITWQSVQIPMVMPKDDLTMLTGGYRGTPVLQIDADIYCDSRCIIAEIERRHPSPPLFASGPLINFGMQHWSDDAFFAPGAALSLHENAANIPEEVTSDREDYFTNLDFSRFEKDAPHFRSQFQAQTALVEQQLSDGRKFLCGDAPEWIDIGAWHNSFMAAGNIPSSERLFKGMNNLLGWRDRMDAFGTGDRTDLPATEALDIAKAATPLTTTIGDDDESGCQAGDLVQVSPVDHPTTIVSGALKGVSKEEIVILRSDERIGEVAVHFPRIGYRIDRVD